MSSVFPPTVEYQITIENTADEAENLRRFDAEWQRLRQMFFGSVLLPASDEFIQLETKLKALANALRHQVLTN